MNNVKIKPVSFPLNSQSGLYAEINEVSLDDAHKVLRGCLKFPDGRPVTNFDGSTTIVSWCFSGYARNQEPSRNIEPASEEFQKLTRLAERHWAKRHGGPRVGLGY